MLNFIKKIFSIFSIFLIFNLTFVNSAQAGPVHTVNNWSMIGSGADNSVGTEIKPQDVLLICMEPKMFVLHNRYRSLMTWF